MGERLSRGWVGFVAGLLVLLSPSMFSACGGGADAPTMTLAEMDRAVRCYNCQQPCFRRVDGWGNSEESYHKCLKRCADRHDVEQELCAVAHPETFTGISRVGPKKKKKKKKNFGRLKAQ